MTIRADSAIREIPPETPEEIAGLQFYLDHPLLLSNVHGGCDEEEQLRRDIDLCSERLQKNGWTSVKVIGAGAFGVVFRAYDDRLRREIAIKVLRPSLHPSLIVRSRFALEAQSLAKCEVPGIISVYRFGEIENTPFIVTELIDGPNLAEYLREQTSPIAPREAVRLAIAIATAVQGMHERAFIHRDLKPSNILLSRENEHLVAGGVLQPIITDFGFVKDIAKPTPNHSVAESIVGTVRYMAPEQALGQPENISTKTDIHALGVILFELLTAKALFKGKDRVQLLYEIAHEIPRSIRAHRPLLSRTLDAIVRKCLEKSPDARYHSAAELVSDLQAYLEHAPTIARPSGRTQRLLHAAGRHKLLTATWFALLAALLAVAVLYQRQVRFNSDLKRLYDEQSQLRLEADSTTKFAVDAFRDIQRQAEHKWNAPGQMKDRLELQRLAFDKFKKFAEKRGYDAYSRHELSIAYHYLSHAESMMELRTEAILHRREGLSLLEQLAREFPENPEYQFDLFMNHMILGFDLAGTNGIPHWERSRREIEDLCARYPENPVYIDARNAIYLVLAPSYSEQSPQGEERGRALVETAMKSSAALMKHHGKPNYGKYVSKGHGFLAQIAAKHNDLQGAKRHCGLAIAANREIAQALGNHNQGIWLQEDEWLLRRDLIRVLRKHDRNEELVEEIKASLPLCKTLESWFPENYGRRWAHIELKLWLVTALTKLGRREEAMNCLIEAKNTRAQTKTTQSQVELVANVDAMFTEAELALK